MYVVQAGNNDNVETVFPSFSHNIDSKKHIQSMDIFSNLYNTRDLEFDHNYISKQIEKFSITPILCSKCNDLSRHFQRPDSYINELYLRDATWRLNSDATLSMNILPYSKLTVPIYDLSNINVKHPCNCPRGKVCLVRDSSEIERKKDFCQLARYSSLSALRRLKDKPFMIKELSFKLQEDVDSGCLVKLSPMPPPDSPLILLYILVWLNCLTFKESYLSIGLPLLP